MHLPCQKPRTPRFCCVCECECVFLLAMPRFSLCANVSVCVCGPDTMVVFESHETRVLLSL